VGQGIRHQRGRLLCGNADPLKSDTKFEIALWLGETKVRLKGEVASTAPGFGIGVRFVNVGAGEREVLGKHIDALAKELA
jgi:hypothetical protein